MKVSPGACDQSDSLHAILFDRTKICQQPAGSFFQRLEVFFSGVHAQFILQNAPFITPVLANNMTREYFWLEKHNSFESSKLYNYMGRFHFLRCYQTRDLRVI